MNKMIVYKITNTINGKLYFGITKVGIRKRWIQHVCNSKRKPYHLYRAMVKHGIQNFKVEIVKVCQTENEMYNLEIDLINKHKSNNSEFGYNNSTGGEISSKGAKRNAKQRERISEYQKKRVRKPFSEETLTKMRLAAKGRDMTNAIKASIAISKGKQAHNIKPVLSINDNGEINYYSSLTVASNKTGVLVTSISNCLKNKTNKSGGLKWKYQQMN